MSKKVVLVITDGIGSKPPKECNAFFKAKKSNYDMFFEKLPYSMITTHGLSVGLPEGQMGNSEVGHMSIGSGRVLYQDLVKISLSLQDGSIKENSALKHLIDTKKRIHIIGLMSDGGVHSHIDHLLGLAKILGDEGKRVFLHLITDGRDVSPTSAPIFLEMIEKVVNKNISIATIGGRFYTMDRDKRWERVEMGYNAIAYATPKSTLTPLEYIDSKYAQDITDEFIEPAAFGDYDGIGGDDGVILANFRSDRARQIAQALGDREFCEFDTKECHKLEIITMTEYDKSFPFKSMFNKDNIKNTLAEVVSRANLTQLHTSETEKYAHVTFFLNGGEEEPFENEKRVLIDSPKVKTYDLSPKMSALEVCDVVISGMDEGIDFIVVNFANGDMVGHTGELKAAIEAVECVDEQLGKIYKKSIEKGYSLVITSDHGNCEEMCDESGNTLTNHTVGDVWCIVSSPEVTKLENGGLDNIAPTVLKLLDLEIPEEMSKPLF